ncbi:RUS1 family protein [Aspergillus affinis]|uniref:RUS1 family protein n=1 Tax=Aspergillus affinis TaxID=1070780 RepID=UPI0022FE0950|nr:DUF647 domain protein [Aspergillus affinis]KAI9039106.1 DUF647 domain protein [Aspergillus affinis]
MASSSPAKRITFTEVDEVNHPTATYIYSEPSAPLQSPPHEDAVVKGRHPSSTIPSSSWSLNSLRGLLIDVFLPVGYPHSVSDDYTSYQIFVQRLDKADCPVNAGVGVGNADASPTSALLLHILQDSSGRVATILFAHRVGTALEPECKKYRLAADVFNDVAIVLDCLSPMIPAGVGRVTVLSTAGVLRALCGVAGGSSKASLSAHFSKWGNLAEVNAKDSSQETIISLIGMLAGSFVVSRVTSYTATWISLVLLLTLHLSLNYAAVRSVQMTSLNRQRTNIVFSTLFESDPDVDFKGFSDSRQVKQRQRGMGFDQTSWLVLSPAEVTMQERIFETDGILRWSSTRPRSEASRIGFCRIGLSVQQFLASSSSYTSSGSLKTHLPVSQLSTLFEEESYILWLHHTNQTCYASILLKNTSTVQAQLKAWAHALLAVRVVSTSLKEDSTIHIDRVLDILSTTLNFLNDNERFDQYLQALTYAGWDVSIDALETKSGRRVISED